MKKYKLLASILTCSLVVTAMPMASIGASSGGGNPVEIILPGSTFTYQNPIDVFEKDEEHYGPALEKGVKAGFRDSFILRIGDTYYFTGTRWPHFEEHASGAGMNIPGVALYKSKDLKNFEYVKTLIERPDTASSLWYKNYFWAPELFTRNGKFYLTVNCSEFGPGKQKQEVAIFVADAIDGDYKPLPESKNGGIDNRRGNNDASLFVDDDGKTYVFVSGVMGREIDLETGRIIGDDFYGIQASPRESKKWDSVGNEGPYVTKQDGIYYMFSSTWGRGYEVCYGYSTEGIKGPWHKSETPLYGGMNLGNFSTYGLPTTLYEPEYYEGYQVYQEAGHNSVFRGPDGRLWIAAHVFNKDTAGGAYINRPCRMVIDPLKFDNGKITIDLERKDPDAAGAYQNASGENPAYINGPSFGEITVPIPDEMTVTEEFAIPFVRYIDEGEQVVRLPEKMDVRLSNGDRLAYPVVWEGNANIVDTSQALAGDYIKVRGEVTGAEGKKFPCEARITVFSAGNSLTPEPPGTVAPAPETDSLFYEDFERYPLAYDPSASFTETVANGVETDSEGVGTGLFEVASDEEAGKALLMRSTINGHTYFKSTDVKPAIDGKNVNYSFRFKPMGDTKRISFAVENQGAGSTIPLFSFMNRGITNQSSDSTSYLPGFAQGSMKTDIWYTVNVFFDATKKTYSVTMRGEDGTVVSIPERALTMNAPAYRLVCIVNNKGSDGATSMLIDDIKIDEIIEPLTGSAQTGASYDEVLLTFSNALALDSVKMENFETDKGIKDMTVLNADTVKLTVNTPFQEGETGAITANVPFADGRQGKAMSLPVHTVLPNRISYLASLEESKQGTYRLNLQSGHNTVTISDINTRFKNNGTFIMAVSKGDQLISTKIVTPPQAAVAFTEDFTNGLETNKWEGSGAQIVSISGGKKAVQIKESKGSVSLNIPEKAAVDGNVITMTYRDEHGTAKASRDTIVTVGDISFSPVGNVVTTMKENKEAGVALWINGTWRRFGLNKLAFDLSGETVAIYYNGRLIKTYPKSQEADYNKLTIRNDGNPTLSSIADIQVVGPEYFHKVDIEIPVEDSAENYTVKVFNWDALGTMVPLNQSVKAFSGQ